MIDSGGDGAFLAPFYEWFKRIVIRLSCYFDPTIWQIFDTAFYIKLSGFFLGKHSKINALHATGYQ